MLGLQNGPLKIIATFHHNARKLCGGYNYANFFYMVKIFEGCQDAVMNAFVQYRSEVMMNLVVRRQT